MTGLLQDLRYGMRQLAARPGFTAIAVLTAALAIGANTAIFSVVNALLLRPLPVDGGERLVLLWLGSESSAMLVFPDGELLDAWRDAGRSFEAIEAFAWGGQRTLDGSGDPRIVNSALISHGFLRALRLRPYLGRGLLPSDEASGATNVVMLGHAFWRAALGGDPGIIGTSLTLDAERYMVIGVAPPQAVLPFGNERHPDLWFPLRRGRPGSYEAAGIVPIGRLRADATVAGAQAELAAVTARVTEEGGALRSAIVRRPQDMLGAGVKRALAVLMGAVGLVLLIACANIANLLLARGVMRERELAVRSALGARRGRLLRQLLVESLLVAVLGGALGLLAAFWGVDIIVNTRPDALRELDQVRMDGRVLIFASVATLTTGLLFGLLPALRALRHTLASTLRSASAGVLGGARARRLSRSLIAGEVALSLVLLVGAGLLVRTLVSLQRQPLGFEPDGLAVATLRVPTDRYPSQTPERRAFFEQVRDAAAALPGVRSAMLVVTTPPNYAVSFGALEIEHLSIPEHDRPDLFAANWVGPDYFDLLGIRIVSGRAFTHDDASRESHVMVNEAFARRFFPAGDAVGRRIRQDPDDPWLEIVGVTADLPAQGLAAGEAWFQLHYPSTETASIPEEQILLQTDVPTESLWPALQAVVSRMGADVPLKELTTVSALLASTLARPRFNLVLLGSLAVLALVLAAVGLFGVVSFAVSQRTREIGIRRALGAPASDVMRLAIAEALRPAAVGLVLGLAGSLLLTRFMTGLLHGLSPRDPLTLVTVPVVLGIVAVVACLVPARRATRVEPATALRWHQ
jgi:putative ABC transport system permease protein